MVDPKNVSTIEIKKTICHVLSSRTNTSAALKHIGDYVKKELELTLRGLTREEFYKRVRTCCIALDKAKIAEIYKLSKNKRIKLCDSWKIRLETHMKRSEGARQRDNLRTVFESAGQKSIECQQDTEVGTDEADNTSFDFPELELDDSQIENSVIEMSRNVNADSGSVGLSQEEKDALSILTTPDSAKYDEEMTIARDTQHLSDNPLERIKHYIEEKHNFSCEHDFSCLLISFTDRHSANAAIVEVQVLFNNSIRFSSLVSCSKNNSRNTFKLWDDDLLTSIISLTEDTYSDRIKIRAMHDLRQVNGNLSQITDVFLSEVSKLIRAVK